MNDLGDEMIALLKRLWPITRSITGKGVRETLSILSEHLPNLKQYEVPSGSKVFDWEVPKEWNIRDAYILDPDGEKIVDLKENNLHVVGYSMPINKKISLQELKDHLYTLPEQPTAIPYITSYYKERWGFCMTQNQFKTLKEGTYTVFIDSDLSNGSLTYGELILPGESTKEVFLSTYVCHPSMANNELSGPVVTTYLAKWLTNLEKRKFTYRIVFIPETIGSITYLSKNLDDMKKNIIAGFNISCVGDDRTYSYLPSRQEDTLSDTVAQHVLKHLYPDFVSYSWLDRGSDERQYCSPGIDLPIASVMRTKYGKYPEYHTSLDNLDVVTETGLYGGYNVLKKCLQVIEMNVIPTTAILAEPQLGKRGLYPTISTKDSDAIVKDMMNLLTYCDGKQSLLEISNQINCPIWDLIDICNKLEKEGVIIFKDSKTL
ncbi:aminopeptidase [Candidatus Marinamargulisbacteria bacterium SCGC AG-343-D04]|nr:aminopeptidase [Candidatus Marinamargulisbacteria bacterium SCGC AG-343-D04]